MEKRAWFTTTQVARELGISPATVRLWCASGKIPAVRVGKKWMIPAEAVEALLSMPPPARSALLRVAKLLSEE